MGMREYLFGLEWGTFEHYPTQQSSIYIRVRNDKKKEDHYFKIKCFNAVTFKPAEFIPDKKRQSDWEFGWLPALMVEGTDTYRRIAEDRRRKKG